MLIQLTISTQFETLTTHMMSADALTSISPLFVPQSTIHPGIMDHNLSPIFGKPWTRFESELPPTYPGTHHTPSTDSTDWVDLRWRFPLCIRNYTKVCAERDPDGLRGLMFYHQVLSEKSLWSCFDLIQED
jgi:hypothetical protein